MVFSAGVPCNAGGGDSDECVGGQEVFHFFPSDLERLEWFLRKVLLSDLGWRKTTQWDRQQHYLMHLLSHAPKQRNFVLEPWQDRGFDGPGATSPVPRGGPPSSGKRRNWR